jgi:hypothetical protein
MEKSILFISGRISEKEVKALNREFQNDEYDILKYEAKGAAISGIFDIVSLIFQDFRLLTFARDYMLGKLLDRIWNGLIPIVNRLKNRQKVVNSVSILVEYQKQDGTILYITFHAVVEKFGIMIKEVFNNLAPGYFEGIEGGRNVSVALDNEDKLTIKVFP